MLEALKRGVARNAVSTEACMKTVLVVDEEIGREITPVLGSLHAHVRYLETRRVRAEHLNPRLIGAYGRMRTMRMGRLEALIAAKTQSVEPDLVITFTDNSLPFHQAARHFPGTDFIALQNGQRWPFENLYLPIDTEQASVYWCFGQNDQENLAIRGIDFREITVVGSFRSSLTPVEPTTRYEMSFDILLVSTWSPRSQDVFSEGFRQVAYWLSKLQRTNPGLRIAIAYRARRGTNASREELNFLSEFAAPQWTHLVPDESGDIYRWCDKSDLVISFGSTVSREVVGRGRQALTILGEWARNKSIYLSNEFFVGDYSAFVELAQSVLLSQAPSELTYDWKACRNVGETDIRYELRQKLEG